MGKHEKQNNFKIWYNKIKYDLTNLWSLLHVNSTFFKSLGHFWANYGQEITQKSAKEWIFHFQQYYIVVNPPTPFSKMYSKIKL